jgi:hypothetical protein
VSSLERDSRVFVFRHLRVMTINTNSGILSGEVRLLLSVMIEARSTLLSVDYRVDFDSCQL